MKKSKTDRFFQSPINQRGKKRQKREAYLYNRKGIRIMKNTNRGNKKIEKRIILAICAMAAVLTLGISLIGCAENDDDFDGFDGFEDNGVGRVFGDREHAMDFLYEMDDDNYDFGDYCDYDDLLEEDYEIAEEEKEYSHIDCSFDGEVLTVFGNGPMDDFIQTATYCPWDDYISVAKTLIIEEGITNIGAMAFNRASSLETVIIPESVTEIGRHAFQYCNSLTSITLPDSVVSVGKGAFYGCGALREVKLSAGMTEIPENMFSYTYELKSITIPSNIKVIGSEAFSYSGLEEIEICNGVEKIGYLAFDMCDFTEVKIPGSVKEMHEWAFFDCYDLENIIIDNVEGTFELYMMNTKPFKLTFTK